MTAPNQDLAPVIRIWQGDRQCYVRSRFSQKYVNVLGNVKSSAPLRSLACTLNNGKPRKLSVGPDRRRLAAMGDFNVDIPITDLREGDNEVVLFAKDRRGRQSDRSLVIHVSDGNATELPFRVDWRNLTSINEVGQEVDGRWSITPDGVKPTTLAYDRVLAMGSVSWSDYEVTLPVTVHQIDTAIFDDPISISPMVGIGLRWQGHANWGRWGRGRWERWFKGEMQPYQGWKPAGASLQYVFQADGSGRMKLCFGDGPGVRCVRNQQLTIGQTLFVRMRVTSSETHPRGLYQCKTWLQGDSPSEGWDIELPDQGLGLPSGSVILVAHHVDATFGDVQVKSLVQAKAPYP